MKFTQLFFSLPLSSWRTLLVSYLSHSSELQSEPLPVSQSVDHLNQISYQQEQGPTVSRVRSLLLFELRPVVQGGGIEIRAIRPNERVNLRIQPNSVEDVDVPQWRVQLAG